MKNFSKYSIYIVFSFAITGAGNLVYDEFLNEGTCPKLGIIPACYVIFACLLIPLMTHFLDRWKVVYFLLTGIALVIATYASIGQLTGSVQCPKTESDIPMCYISFGIFSGLILLKLLPVLKNVPE